MNPFGRLDLNHSENTSFARKGVLSTASVGVQGIVRFAYSVIIGRVLTPAILSATNSAISLALFISLLWPTATSTAATKFIARSQGAGDHDLAARVASHLARVTTVAAVALAIPAGLFSFFFQARGDLVTAVLVMVLVIAWAGYTYVRGAYFAVGQIGRALVWDTISASVSVGLLVGVVMLRWDAVLLLPITVGYLLYAIIGWPRRPANPGLERDLAREINSFTAWTVIGTLASTGFLQLTMVVAHAVGPGNASGMYAAALTLATPASMLARSFSLLLFPSMAKATGQSDFESVRRQTDLATRALIVVMGAIFGTIALLSAPIVRVVYGQKYADAATILPILLVAALLVTLNVGAVNALSTSTSTGVRIPAILSVAGMVLGLVAMVVLIPLTGVIGVAWSYLVGTAIIGFGPIVVVWRQEGLRWSGLWLRFLVGALVAVLLAVAAKALEWGYLGDILATAAFLLVWGGLMYPDLGVLNSVRKPARRTTEEQTP